MANEKRRGKRSQAPKLPKPEQKRADLIHEHRCVACGYQLGVTDLNDSSHFRDFVRAGAKVQQERAHGPLSPVALAHVRRAYAEQIELGGMREDCPCGAIVEHVAGGDSLLGTTAIDRSLPIVDGVFVRGKRLVVIGRFLADVQVKHERGVRWEKASEAEGLEAQGLVAIDVDGVSVVARPLKPWQLRQAKAEQRESTVTLRTGRGDPVAVTQQIHELELEHPILPAVGEVLVLTITGTNGPVTISVEVRAEALSEAPATTAP